MCRVVLDVDSFVMFAIEDEIHADFQGQFADLAMAMAELERRAGISWDQPPNQAPCTSWRTCGRAYDIIEYDDTAAPWREIRRIRVLEISSKGTKWIAKDVM
jgi:hypothetical protein